MCVCSYLRSYPYGYCCLCPICMFPIGPGGPLLYCSPIPLLGPGCMNCSPASSGERNQGRNVCCQAGSRNHAPLLPKEASPTFPHAAKRVLVGLIGPHPAHHLGSPHPRLVALGVGGHGVPPGECRVSAVSERILQVHTTPAKGDSGEIDSLSLQ